MKCEPAVKWILLATVIIQFSAEQNTHEQSQLFVRKTIDGKEKRTLPVFHKVTQIVTNSYLMILFLDCWLYPEAVTPSECTHIRTRDFSEF